MKKRLPIILLLALFSIIVLTFVSCSKNDDSSNSSNNNSSNTENSIYTEKVADEKYLKERLSEATAIYYMSSKDGQFGDDNYLFESTLLPNEYTEVDYIESNGDQYIDTGIEYNETLSFDLKFSNYTTAANCGGIFGTDGLLFSLSRISANSIIWVVDGQKKYQYNSFSPYKEYSIQCSNTSFAINDSTIPLSTGTDSIGSGNITIFKTLQGLGTFRLHKFKISDEETVVRNFIPCYRNYDEQVGLFDLVSKSFFTNSMGDNFVVEETDIEYKNLPADFVQVSYLEATGGQYIDTGIVPTSDMIWKIDCSFSTFETMVMGCLQQNGPRFHFGIWNNNNGYHPGLYDGYDSTGQWDTIRHKFILNANNNSFYIDNNQYGGSSWLSPITSNALPTLSIYLFARNDGSNISNYMKGMKLYSTSIYKGETLVAEYIPCYRKSDNILGLFETVSNVFYSNNGTGNFKKGTTVTAINEDFKQTYSQIEYIESSGTQYIDTGIKANSLTSFAIEYSLSSLNDDENYILGNDMIKVYPASSKLSIECAGETKELDYLSTDKKLTLSIAQGVLYYKEEDGELSVGDTFTTSFNSANNLFLFAVNDTSISYAKSTKIFACKIYQGTELVRDFIPVVKIQTKEIGLYDIVEKTFYANAGSGTFHSIYDYSKDKEEVKNLLNVESISSYKDDYHNVRTISTSNETGTLKIVADGDNAHTGMCYNIGQTANQSWSLIPITKGLTYRLSFDAVDFPASSVSFNYFNENKQVVFSNFESANILNIFNYYYFDITIPDEDDIKYIWFRFGLASSKANDVISVENLQFRQSINALAFVPYSGASTNSYYSSISSVSTTSSPQISISSLEEIEEPIMNNELSYTNELSKVFDTSLETLSTIPSSLFTNQSNNGTLSIVTNAYGRSKAMKFVSNGEKNRVVFKPSIPLEANVTFTVSYDYFSSIAIDGAIKYELFGGDYTWNGEFQSYSTPGTWQRISLTYTTTSETLLYLFIYGVESVPVYIDNLQLVFGTQVDYSNGYTKCYERDTYKFIQETKYDCSCIFFENEENTTPNIIYSARVLNGSHLLYNFTPCINELKNQTGLYENINELFYSDNGMGLFSYSNETLLPSEFVQVEYIKANGKQYIDTNFKPNQDTKVEMMITSSGSYAYYFGCWDVAYNNGAYALGNDGTNIYVGYDGQGGGVGSSIISNGSHFLIKDKNRVYIDGKLLIEQNYIGFQTNNNLYLFTQNRAGFALQPIGSRTLDNSYIYCKYCKIYDNGTLIRHLIPCYRVIDNEIGMYDLITEVFFTNSGTDKFECGTDTTSTTYDEDMLNNYEVLESIDFDGTRNIDLEIGGEAKYTFDIQFKTNVSHRQLMGYNGYGCNYWGVHQDGYYESESVWTEKAGNRDIIIDEYKNGIAKRYLNSTLMFEKAYSSLNNSTYRIGALNANRQYACYFTIYSLKVEKNGTLIRSYIPAKRLTDSSIGLFDTITQQFIVVYNNAMGFTHGDEIGHSFDNGKVVSQVSEKQDGEILYTCKICGKEIRKHIDSYSYSVTFKYDEGVDYIKVYKGYDFSSYEKTNIGYTRNANTNNFSRNNGVVYFEIVYKKGYKLNKISTGGTMCSKEKDNIYKVSYISINTTYNISTSKVEE